MFLVFRAIHDSLEDFGESEAQHQHHGHQERGHDQLNFFIVLRLLVYLAGCFLFASYSEFMSSEESFSKQLRGYQKKSFVYASLKKESDNASALSMNYYTVYLSFKFGLLHAITFLSIEYIDFLRDLKGEMILAVCMLIYTLAKTKFIFKLSTEILLQGLPNINDIDLNKIMLQIQKVPEVVKVKQTHYWAVTPQHFIFSSQVIITSFHAKSQVEEAINTIVTPYFSEILIDFDEQH